MHRISRHASSGHASAVLRAAASLALATTTAGIAALVSPSAAAAAAWSPASERPRTVISVRAVDLGPHAHPGKVAGRGGLDLHFVGSGPLTATNLAEAQVACNDCHAAAISFQVVIASSPPSIAATDLALATTIGCTGCSASAITYQFVIATGDPARLTQQGRQRLAAVDAQLRAIARAGLAPDAMPAAVQPCVDEVVAVLQQDLRQRPAIHARQERTAGPHRELAALDIPAT